MVHRIFFSALIGCLALSAFKASAQTMWVQTEGPGDVRNLEINFDSSGGVYFLTGWDNQSDRLFRTTNDGVTWSRVPLPPGLAFNLRTLPDGNLLMQIDTDVQLSADYGQTWNPILRIPKPTPAFYGGLGGGSSPALASAELAITINGEIFVWYGVNTFRSSNDGQIWDTLPGPPEYLESIYSFTTPTLFAFGSSGYFYRSTDSGQSWGRIINGVSDNVDWLSGSPNGLLFCNVGGEFYISQDDGRTWRDKFGCTGYAAVTPDDDIAVCNDFAVVVFDSSGNLLKQFQSPNNFAFEGPISVGPNGKIWTDGPVWVGPDTSEIEKYAPLPAGVVTSLIYLGGDSILANYYLSTDHGNTWINNPGYNLWYKVIAGNYSDITKLPYLVTSNGYEYFGSSTTGIYRSPDGGNTWDNLNKGLNSLSVICFAVDSSGNLFTATGDGIYRSTDDALDWTSLDAPSNISSIITSIAINTNGDVVASAGSAGIYWTQDTGSSWNPIGTGLSGTVNCMLSTPDGHVFAGTDSGVFYLPQGGSTWENASDGLSNLDVLTLIRDTAGTVYVGTNGDGMFRSIQTYNNVEASSFVQGAISIPNDLSLTAYPNPCTSSSTITFSCASSGAGEVTILNLLGAEVARIYEGELSAGEHSFTWDASGAVSGMYECVVNVNGNVQRTELSHLK